MSGIALQKALTLNGELSRSTRSQTSNMQEKEFWIYEEYLTIVLEGLAYLVDYPFSENDLIAISEGIQESNEDGERWYEYIYDCDNRADLLLAKELGSSMCTITLSTNANITQGLDLLIWLGQGNFKNNI